MSAANVMISKLGGLTTFEALACRVPIIADVITEPMPQEAGHGQSDRRTGCRDHAKAFDRRRTCRATNDGGPSPLLPLTGCDSRSGDS